ncbi:MAG TPA: hypothetical protein VMP89_13145 [Solirubrobacteraceae bacterium]|nr:hypothetical protein [Solirubrobacteraceae bacterium]
MFALRTVRTVPAVALAASALWAAHVSAASAALQPIAPSVSEFSSDGHRYAAWQVRDDAPVEVLDTATRRTSTIVPPVGCRLQDQGEGGLYLRPASSGRFLLDCQNERTVLLDVRSAHARLLPAVASWSELGAQYAVGDDEDQHELVLNLASGTIRRVRGYPNIELDHTGLPRGRSICRGLRAAVQREGIEDRGNFAYHDGLFAHLFGRHGDVQIQRCDGTRTVFRGQRVGSALAEHAPRSFDLGGGVLSWDTGVEADTVVEGRAAGPAALFALRPGSPLRRWALPLRRVAGAADEGGGPSAYGYSAHTLNEVFWLATRTLSQSEAGPDVATMTVYAAPLDDRAG